MKKSLRTRKLSISSDISEIDVDIPQTPGKRIRQSSDAPGTPTRVNTRATRRLMYAVSEPQSSLPAARTMRKTRASSTEPESLFDQNKSRSDSPIIKTRKQASMLPSSSLVKKQIELEDHIPYVRLESMIVETDEITNSGNSDSSPDKALLHLPQSQKTKKRQTISEEEIDEDESYEKTETSIDSSKDETLQSLEKKNETEAEAEDRATLKNTQDILAEGQYKRRSRESREIAIKHDLAKETVDNSQEKMDISTESLNSSATNKTILSQHDDTKLVDEVINQDKTSIENISTSTNEDATAVSKEMDKIDEKEYTVQDEVTDNFDSTEEKQKQENLFKGVTPKSSNTTLKINDSTRDSNDVVIQDDQSSVITETSKKSTIDISPEKTDARDVLPEKIVKRNLKRKSTDVLDNLEREKESLQMETSPKNQENTEIADDVSNIEGNDLFEDIPADKWKKKNNVKTVSDQSTSQSVRKVENDNEIECDLVLVDRREYDSDDTVLLKRLDAAQTSYSTKKLDVVDEKLIDIDSDENEKQVKRPRSRTKERLISEIDEDSPRCIEDEDNLVIADKSNNRSKTALNRTNDQSISRLNKSKQTPKTRRSSKASDESDKEVENDVNKLNRSSLISNKNTSLRKSVEGRTSINKSSKDTSMQSISTNKSRIDDSEEEIDKTDTHAGKKLNKEKCSWSKSRNDITETDDSSSDSDINREYNLDEAKQKFSDEDVPADEYIYELSTKKKDIAQIKLKEKNNKDEPDLIILSSDDVIRNRSQKKQKKHKKRDTSKENITDEALSEGVIEYVPKKKKPVTLTQLTIAGDNIHEDTCQISEKKKKKQDTSKENITDKALSEDVVELKIFRKEKPIKPTQLTIVNDNIREDARHISEKRKKKKKKQDTSKENIVNEAVYKGAIELKIPKKKKRTKLIQLPIVEDNTHEDICLINEREKKKNEKQRTLQGYITEKVLTEVTGELQIPKEKKSVKFSQLVIIENDTRQDVCQNKKSDEKEKKKQINLVEEDKNINEDDTCKNTYQSNEKKKKKGEALKKNITEEALSEDIIKLKISTKKEPCINLNQLAIVYDEVEIRQEAYQINEKEKKKMKKINVVKKNENVNEGNILQKNFRENKTEMAQQKKNKIVSNLKLGLSTDKHMPKKKTKQQKAVERTETLWTEKNPLLVQIPLSKLKFDKNLLSLLQDASKSKNVHTTEKLNKATAKMCSPTELKSKKKRDRTEDIKNVIRLNVPTKKSKKEMTKFLPSSRGLKRLSDDVIENLTDVPLRAKRRQKISRNEDKLCRQLK